MRISWWSQPRADQMRLEVPDFRRRDACRGEMYLIIPRCIISSAISRPGKSTDGALLGLFADQRDHQASLLSSDLRRFAWTWCICKLLNHRQFSEQYRLQADPAPAPTAKRIHVDSQVSG